MPIVLFLSQLATTLLMTGVIWFVQIVHYPLFAQVGPAGFPHYSHQHATRTGWVVAPLMLAELGTAGLALLKPFRVAFFSIEAAIGGFVLLAVIWLSTGLLQIPRHNRLAGGFDRSTAASLVGTNWVRTVAWTLRSALLLWCLWYYFECANCKLHPAAILF